MRSSRPALRIWHGKKEKWRIMKVCVDQSKCRTAGLCVQLCPEVFRFEPGSKKAVALDEAVPVDAEGRCWKAVRKCPVGAIVVTEAACT